MQFSVDLAFWNNCRGSVKFSRSSSGMRATQCWPCCSACRKVSVLCFSGLSGAQIAKFVEGLRIVGISKAYLGILVRGEFLRPRVHEGLEVRCWARARSGAWTPPCCASACRPTATSTGTWTAVRFRSCGWGR